MDTNLLQQNLRDSWTPLAPAQLESFERLHRIQLPNDYRQFLLANNGGKCFAPLVVTIDGRGIKGRPRIYELSGFSFYGLGLPEAAKWRDLDNQFKIHDGRLPRGTVAIADCNGNDLLLLDLSTGEICLWERDAELSTAPEANRIPVAQSLAQFIDRLRYVPLDERRSSTLAESEPFVSVEAFDFDGFLKWANTKWQSLDMTQRRDTLAAACENANYEVAEWILTNGTAPKGRKLLASADNGGCADLVILLLQHGAELQYLRTPQPYTAAYIDRWEAANAAKQ